MACVKAQVVDDTMHVIYAKQADRIAIRTNPITWALQCPNIGFEYAVRPENWNRWTVGLNVMGRWKGSNTFNPATVFNLNEIRFDFKNYWRERFVRGEGAHALDGNTDPHKKWIDKLFSLRRKNFYNEADPKHTYPYLKHPTIVFYRGIYGSFDKFSAKFSGIGYQGTAISVGGTYGIVRTLHEYEKAGRLDMELGLSAGWIFLPECQEYSLNRITNSYVREGEKYSKFIPFPVVTDLRVGFVYHFGKMPLSQQYRWRYDADSAFHVLVDSLAADRQAKWEQKQIDKSYALYIKPVKTIIADARKTLNSWPDSLYSYPRMVLERAIEQAVRDSSEILPPVYVNKGIVYDKDADMKIDIIKRELDYYRNRAASYVAKEERIKFVADSLYRDSVQRVIDDSISVMKRNKFVADSLRKDSLGNAKRLKFVNDSIYKDSVKRAKEALSDSLKAAKLEARERTAEGLDSLATGEATDLTPDNNGEEVVPIEQDEENTAEESTEQPVAEDQSPTEEQSSEESSEESQSSDQPVAEEQTSTPTEENTESQDNGGGNDDSASNTESEQDNSNGESEQTETSNESENNGNEE
ncbi:MAG: DUF3575 domain-containing protein [Bacteroidaceae bacterium]|nr:DUF3575 domain-containing protein [Bacteroidaceae bacterium]